MYFLLALISVVIAIALWKGATEPFLSKHKKFVGFDLALEPIDLTLDFFKAVSTSIEKGVRLPIGVCFHGLFLLLTAIFLVIAWA